MRKKFKLLLFSCLLGLLCYVIIYSYRLRGTLKDRYPIYLSSLSGNYLTSIEDVRSLIEDELKLGFFGVSTNKIKRELKKLAWIKEVEVSRRLPNKLSIKLYEYKFLAYFDIDGVVTQDRLILKRSSIKNLKHLPWFIGSKNDVGRLIMAYNELLLAIEGSNFSIKLLEVMADKGLRAIISSKLYNFVVYFGRQDFMNRVNKFRLLTKTMLTSQNYLQKINYLDLRYTNGVAISWINENK